MTLATGGWAHINHIADIDEYCSIQYPVLLSISHRLLQEKQIVCIYRKCFNIFGNVWSQKWLRIYFLLLSYYILFQNLLTMNHVPPCYNNVWFYFPFWIHIWVYGQKTKGKMVRKIKSRVLVCTKCTKCSECRMLDL